jgi:hypothetical protein
MNRRLDGCWRSKNLGHLLELIVVSATSLLFLCATDSKMTYGSVLGLNEEEIDDKEGESIPEYD